MPRNPVCAIETIMNVLQEAEINPFDEDGTVTNRNHEKFREAAELTNTGISGPTLNYYVRTDEELQQQLRTFFKIAAPQYEKSCIESIDNSACSDSTYSLFSTRNDFLLQKIYDNISLDTDEWVSIKPLLTFEQNKLASQYWKLKEGWTDMLAEKIYEKFKLPCAISFKRAKISTTGNKPYLTIKGYCTECSEQNVEGHCLNEPDSNTGITIEMVLVDSRGYPHEKRRQVKGSRREKIGTELLNKKPGVWLNEAGEQMDFGAAFPPSVPKLATLRKLKQEAVAKDLHLDKVKDLISSLRQMKSNSEYAGSIKQIAVDKFSVMYWSPFEIYNYKNPRRHRKVEIDATGTIAKPINNTNGESNTSYLYQIVQSGEATIAPIAQMISEKHDVNMISYWLGEFLKEAPTPDEAVSDYSLALLNAMCLSFNKRTLKTYVTDCFRTINNVVLQHPICTYIRVDIAHLMNILCKKKIFNGKLPSVKDFYARCLGLLTTCKSLRSFKKLMKNVLIVALSECDGQDDVGNDIQSETKKKKIFRKIETFSINEQDMIDRECFDDSDDLEEVEEISLFIQGILEEAEKIAELCKGFQRPNPYYSPQIVDVLIKLAKQFPLWTNVMGSTFPQSASVASSARCESYFKELKSSLGGQAYKPLRADKFIAKHLRWIENSTKFERAAKRNKNATKKTTKNKRRKQDPHISFENNHLHHEEEWRGKNHPEKILSDDDSRTEVDILDNSADNFIKVAKDAEILPSTGPEVVIPDIQAHIMNAIENDEILYPFHIEPDLPDTADNFMNMQENTGNVCKLSHYEDCHELITHGRAAIGEKQLIHPSTQQRGKYLRPCPAIQNIHNNKMIKRHKNTLLMNGNQYPLQAIGDKMVAVRNTCPYDSLVEVISHAYVENHAYREEIKKNTNSSEFHRFIDDYVTSGTSRELYLRRTSILMELFDINGNNLNCSDNLASFTKRLFKKSRPFISSMNDGLCTKCSINVEDEIVLEISPEHIWSHTVSSGLQSFLNKHFSDNVTLCKKCKVQIDIQKVSGVHLLIDSEFAFYPGIHKYMYKNSSNTMILVDAPIILSVNSIKYTLNGIIAYDQGGGNLGHYRAFCRGILGSWVEMNDLSKKPHPVKNPSSKKISPAIFFYTKCNAE